jgi:multiple antibiotic resistance protein
LELDRLDGLAMTEALIYIKVFIALLVLVNPLEGIPVFLAGTQSMSPAGRRAIARTAAIGVMVILLVALFLGRAVLDMLSISIGAFTTAGGIIIFLVALKMVLGDSKPDESQGQSSEVGEGFALVPLATPLLAGPGAISSVIVYASKGATNQGASLINDAILSAIILLVGLTTWAALRAADRLRRVLGETGINVCTRVSGILVAAIAVQMMHDGLLRLFPQLAT